MVERRDGEKKDGKVERREGNGREERLGEERRRWSREDTDRVERRDGNVEKGDGRTVTRD